MQLFTIFTGVILFISIYFSGIRNIFNKSPFPILTFFLYSIIGIFLLFFVTSHRYRKLISQINKKFLISIMFSFLLILSFLVFKGMQWNNNMKPLGLDSTGDDAMILPAKAFFESIKDTYNVKLYDGAPISPGPGWILLNSIFSINNIYYLVTPFWLLIYLTSIFLLYKSISIAFSSLLLMISSIIFFTSSIVGHDHVSISLSIGISFALVLKMNSSKHEFWRYFLLAIFVGTLSTSRIIFVYLPFIYFIMIDNKKYGIMFFIISLFTIILWHASFFAISEYYQPFHLFNRGRNNVGFFIIAIGIIGESILALYSFYLYYKSRFSLIEKMNLGLYLLSYPLLLIAFGELQHVNYNFTKWEGANYLIPIFSYGIISYFGTIHLHLKNHDA